MVPHSLSGAYSDTDSQVLWEDGERVFRRGWQQDDNGKRRAVLIVQDAADQSSRTSFDRFAHEYELRNELDDQWALRPLDLVRNPNGCVLVLEDARCEPLTRLLG